MIPIRRDLHFKLQPTSVNNWHARGAYLTHFINAMSISFPDGERYFIHTVRHYRDRISDAKLQKAVAAFIGQEAMHGREHEDYNRLLAEAGLPAEELAEHFRRFVGLLKDKLSPSAQLSVTIAQEHLTAIIAELVLTDPRLIAGADRQLSALWRWHALEEIEHKAVAFDVYQTVVGRGLKAYLLRTSSMLLTTAGFFGLVLFYQRKLLNADPQPNSWKGLSGFADFMFRAPALLPRLALPWLSYLRPGFHPWDHNNRHLLGQLDQLVSETRDYALKAA
ncbi:MAG: metal-dependent hydrolase [Pseudomonadota bacterium]